MDQTENDDCSTDTRTLRDLFVEENLDKPCKVAFQSHETKVYQGQVQWRIKQSDLNVQNHGIYKECDFSIGNPDFCNVKLRIYPSGKTLETKSFVSFSVSFQSKLPQHSDCCCSIAFVDKNGEIKSIKKEKRSGVEVDEISFESFIPKSTIQNYLVEDMLVIYCSIEIHLNSYFSVCDDDQFSCYSHGKINPPSEGNIKRITTDAVVQIEQEKIKVNKALLMSEIPVTNIGFRGAPEDVSFKPSWKMKPHTFRRILNYVYTKSIDITTFKDAYEIYSAACQLKLSNLTDICAAYLIGNMNIGNMHHIMHLVDEYKDNELKTAYLEFLENQKLDDLSI